MASRSDGELLRTNVPNQVLFANAKSPDAQRALLSLGSFNLSLECGQWILSTLHLNIHTVQGVGGSAILVNASGTATPYGSTLFPITPDLAAASQAQADVKWGVTGVTVAQYFGSLPGVHAAAQYLGNTVFVNTNYFASIGDGWALLTLLHESLHLFGLGDQEIENAFGISKATATSSGSDSITSKLFEKCNGK